MYLLTQHNRVPGQPPLGPTCSIEHHHAEDVLEAEGAFGDGFGARRGEAVGGVGDPRTQPVVHQAALDQTLDAEGKKEKGTKDVYW